MSPPTPTRPDSPEPIEITSSGSQLEAATTQSQRPGVDRPKRNRTPTPRGRQFQDDIRRTKALSAKIQQTKALNALNKGQGGGNGQAKRRGPAPGDDARDTDGEEGQDDEDSDDDTSWIVDSSSTVVPTSDPRELEQGGSTFQTQLDDSQFRANLTERLVTLLGDEAKNPSRQALKTALKFVRRDKEGPLGTSQRDTQANSLPEQALEGGGGYHLDYQPQPNKTGQKRRFVAPPLEMSKRGRLTATGTATTVLDHTPSPIARPVFTVRRDPAAPPLLPPSAADYGALDPPRRLPASGAIPVTARSWPQPVVFGRQSPSPLPAGFRVEHDAGNTQIEDTQTVPEDTQTIPEDTQTVPEDTQTQPGVAQPARTASSQPRASQPLALSPRASVPLRSQLPSRSASQLDAMSDRFDRNEHYRARAHAMRRQRKAKRGNVESDDGELMEEDEADQEEAESLAAGRPARRKRKAGINCQPGRPRQVASRAVTDASAYALAKCAYFNRETGIIWSLEAYDRAAEVEFPGKQVNKATVPLTSAICDRLPGARTAVKVGMRSTIMKSYGFIEEPETEEEISKNLLIHQEIQEDFHMGSLDNPRTHYEHPALKKAFLAGFFAARHSPCAIYHHYFNPVPVETFATLLVMMEACIAEWRTGTLVKEHLNAKTQAVMYGKHLANLELFAKRAPVRFLKMREDFYAAGVRKAVPIVESEFGTKATIRMEDIRGDTPPPADLEANGGLI